MISEKIQKAINEQINKELYSEYLYLSMAAALESMDLSGMAHFFEIQVQEERAHAMKFYHYLIERGGEVKLNAIDKPQTEFKSAEEIFSLSLDHEKFVTRSILDLVKIAREENDRSFEVFLDWYVTEQDEEEANMESWLKKTRMVGDNGTGLLMLDKEAGARIFNPAEYENK